MKFSIFEEGGSVLCCGVLSSPVLRTGGLAESETFTNLCSSRWTEIAIKTFEKISVDFQAT